MLNFDISFQNINKQNKELQQMYSQIKSSYKKSRQEFLQQIRAMRKQFESKANNAENNYTYMDRIIRTRQNSNKGQMTSRPKFNHMNLKAQLEVAVEDPEVDQKVEGRFKGQVRRQRVHNNQNKRSSALVINNNLIVRQNSLPQRVINSRTSTAESKQSNFQPFFLKIPSSRQRRTNNQLLPALYHLREHNKLFQHLDQYISLCLLKIGYYHEIQAGNVLYGAKFDKNSFYIILSGIICLINNNIGLKKLVFGGETLGEQMLFGVSTTKHLLEHAKATVKTYVLEIRTNDYISMTEELKKLGYLKCLQEFEDCLRDGFTNKNIARNQHIIERRNTRMKTQF